MESLLSGLNPAQHTAVTSPASVLQVLAPPGSGKTKTLTARVAHLLQHDGFAPWNIIVCTFTVKAAREMKERIGNLIGGGLESRLVLGTFHSVARRYLVRYGHLVGVKKGFGIADTSDNLSTIKVSRTVDKILSKSTDLRPEDHKTTEVEYRPKCCSFADIPSKSSMYHS